ncbi:GATA zinc finger domain-containing protein 12 isoform X2 [Ooceraea biroi]|uniref:GATA zinc finger domain-containing protein 12 isoform X2 n=1 Tax=Ooceraea biroi TaxID=2015173 RepID=UPI0005BD5EDB|nr:GATA zinc finger domain-containing protein 12 isoform X2 [Ooceraea biroi]
MGVMQMTENTAKERIETLFKAAHRSGRRMWSQERYKILCMYDLQMDTEKMRKQLIPEWKQMPLEQKLSYIHRAIMNKTYRIKRRSSYPCISSKSSVLTDDDVVHQSDIVNNNNDNNKNDSQQDISSDDDSNALTNGNSDNSDSNPMSPIWDIPITSPLCSTNSNHEQDPLSLLIYPDIAIDEDYDFACDLDCSICAPFIRYECSNMS